MLLVLIIGAGAIWVAQELFVRAKQILAPTGQDVINNESRPMILYLRSFALDDTRRKKGTPEGYLFSLEWFDGYQNSFEYMLCQGLEQFGSVLALSKAHERRPPIGAARLKILDTEWKPEFCRLIKKSRLVCLVVWNSSGLLWEFKYLVENFDPKKILVLIPQQVHAWNPEIFRDFVEATRKLIDWGSIENYPENTIAIIFDSNWTPSVIWVPLIRRS